MPDLVQLLGQKYREWLHVVNTPLETEKAAEVEHLIYGMLQDVYFLEYLKFDPQKMPEKEKVPDFLFSIGVKLAVSYMGTREDSELGKNSMDRDEIENIYYAASAFIHMSQMAKLGMMFD